MLTGITDAMVAGAPRLEAALPAFLEFAAGSVLVAHNAPFDVGFLKAACARHGHAWPAFQVVDTVRLARHVVTRDEAPNCKLGTLARVFRSPTTPNHRALDDARATVDVLHGLLERLGGLGVQSLEELTRFSARVRAEQRRKRYLAEGLPTLPGVYRFEGARGEVLYVGTSGNIRNRVRSYFTAAESRARMAEMVGLAERVVPIVCATRLEAQVRELRLIAEHKPRYNRRSRFPERAVWLKLTEEAFPRLSLVRQVRADDAAYLGPFSSSRAARSGHGRRTRGVPVAAVPPVLVPPQAQPGLRAGRDGPVQRPVRRPGERDGVRGARARRASGDADRRLRAGRTATRPHRTARAVRALRGRGPRPGPAGLLRPHRGPPAAAARPQRVPPTRRRAPPASDGVWDIAVVRHGRLAALGDGARPPMPCSVRSTPRSPPPPPSSRARARCRRHWPRRPRRVLRWLEQPGTRLVSLEGEWSCPTNGAGRWVDWLAAS